MSKAENSFDNLQNVSDPRTVHGLEQTLMAAGGIQLGRGLFKFDDTNRLMQVQSSAANCTTGSGLSACATGCNTTRAHCCKACHAPCLHIAVQAISTLFNTHPWIWHNDPSHIAQGDVATVCTEVVPKGKSLLYIKLVHFEL